MDMRFRPFFSIGLTTYDRREMLIESINSILGQSFQDFEIFVGNDYTLENISSESLNISDKRITFINNPQNIGELRNMNSLLEKSHGRYFTWLADDDIYFPDFLESAYEALKKHDFPSVVFTSYMTGKSFETRKTNNGPRDVRILSGKEFLNKYLSRTLKIIGCYGLFDAGYLRGIGGMEKLGTGFSPYSDNLLAIRSGLLDRVAVMNAPLLFFRTHPDSISYASPDLSAYQSAQHALIGKSLDVFRASELRDDFHDNLLLLLTWCLKDYYSVILRSGRIRTGEWLGYLLGMRKFVRLLDSKHKYGILKLATKLHPVAVLEPIRVIANKIWKTLISWFRSPTAR